MLLAVVLAVCLAAGASAPQSPSPPLPSGLDLLSRPVTYLTWAVASADGKLHRVQVYFDCGAEIAVDTPDQAAGFDYPQAEGLLVAGVGTPEQPVLARKGDDVRIDWGYAYLAGQYRPVLTKWAQYLKEKGSDPENQLCTDDFAGHLSHNANLSAKAIVALGAFARLCELRSEKSLAAEYRKLAEGFAARWVTEADDGDHYRLAFERPGTWSQKYSLVWNRILGLNLFPNAVAKKEMAYDRRIQEKYGLPLDNRRLYTKLDWITWTAILTGSRADFEALLDPVFEMLNATPHRMPMTDCY